MNLFAESVSDVVLGIYSGANNEIIYAIFTTPQNSIPGSAVCAFSMRDILDVFEGPFKEQKDLNSNWIPVPIHKVSPLYSNLIHSCKNSFAFPPSKRSICLFVLLTLCVCCNGEGLWS